MKKPENYDLKAWLSNHDIKGLIVHYYHVGTDSSDTDWELIPTEGNSKRVKASIVQELVTLRPDWMVVMDVKDSVLSEVNEYREFLKREITDLAEYNRLKQKFEQ
jgi:hypothetical protein